MPQANPQEWMVLFEVVGCEAEPEFAVCLLAKGTTCYPWISEKREAVIKDLGARQLWDWI